MAPDIFISLRFSEAEDAARALKRELTACGLNVFLCAVPEGESILDQVARALASCTMAVILGTRTYGMKTDATFSSYQELHYILSHKKPFFLVKMCEYYQVDSTRLQLTNDISYYEWQPTSEAARQNPPFELVHRIHEKLSSLQQPSSPSFNVGQEHPRDSPSEVDMDGSFLGTGASTEANLGIVNDDDNGDSIDQTDGEEDAPLIPLEQDGQQHHKPCCKSRLKRFVKSQYFAFCLAGLALTLTLSLTLTLVDFPIYRLPGYNETNVFIVGGRVGALHGGTEFFHEGSWYNGPSLSPRERLAVVVYEDMIYAMGGYGKSGFNSAISTYVDAFDGDRWNAAGVLPLGVASAGATVFRGCIYVIGGLAEATSAEGQPCDRVQVFCGAQGWHQGPSLPGPISDAAAATLADKIYLTGGTRQAMKISASRDVLSFDGSTWSPAPPMHTARSQHATAVYEDSLYVIGGFTGYEGNYLDAVEVFDAGCWYTAPALPAPRGLIQATVFQDLIFVAGGQHKQVYTFDGSSWSQVHSLHSKRRSPGVVTYWTRPVNKTKSDETGTFAQAAAELPSLAGDFGSDAKESRLFDRIFILGGQTEYSFQRKDVLQWTGSQWTEAPAMPTPRQSLAAVLFQGRLYALGGVQYNPSPRFLQTVELFDGHEWLIAAPMLATRSSFVAVEYLDRVLVLGGENSSGVLAATETFDGTSWQQGIPMLKARKSFGAACFRACIYVVGGSDASGQPIKHVEAFDGHTWSSSLPLHVARSSPGVVAFQNRMYVMGGFSHGRDVPDVEAFDAATWTCASSMTSPRSRFGLAAVNNTVHVLGGYTADGLALGSTQLFNVTTWAEGVPLPQALADMAAVAASSQSWNRTL